MLLNKHHSHREIAPYYKAADLCLVTSLHDGMNLVAKEFVAARSDEQGALILSNFTGASRELHDALTVNPYDTEQLADAILFALEMNPDDRSARMMRMRRVVKEHNIYRWAANLIAELAEVRLETMDSRKASQPGVIVMSGVGQNSAVTGAVNDGQQQSQPASSSMTSRFL